MKVVSKEMNKKLAKKPSRLHLVLIVMVLILAFLQIIFANRLTTAGEILNNLEKETKTLESENRKLANQIAQLGSLGKIKNEVEKLGFVQNPSVFNLSTEKEVALKF